MRGGQTGRFEDDLKVHVCLGLSKLPDIYHSTCQARWPALSGFHST